MKRALESLSIAELQRIIFVLVSVIFLMFITDNPLSKAPIFLVSVTAVLTFLLTFTFGVYHKKTSRKRLRQFIKTEWQNSKTRELCIKYHLKGAIEFSCVILGVLFVACNLYVVFVEWFIDNIFSKYNIELRNLVATCAGALIGCIPACFALVQSRDQAKQQHDESELSRRYSLLPCLDISFEPMMSYPSTFSDVYAYIQYGDSAVRLITERIIRRHLNEELFEANQKRLYYIRIKNIGCGPALKVGSNMSMSFGSFGSGDSRTYIIFSPRYVDLRVPHTIQLLYNDVFSGTHSSSVIIHTQNDEGIIIEPVYKKDDDMI